MQNIFALMENVRISQKVLKWKNKNTFFERYFYMEHLKRLIPLYCDESESPAIWAEMDATKL